MRKLLNEKTESKSQYKNLEEILNANTEKSRDLLLKEKSSSGMLSERFTFREDISTISKHHESPRSEQVFSTSHEGFKEKLERIRSLTVTNRNHRLKSKGLLPPKPKQSTTQKVKSEISKMSRSFQTTIRDFDSENERDILEPQTLLIASGGRSLILM